MRRDVHEDEADRDTGAHRGRVRRGEPVAAGDEDKQHRKRDPARHARGIDLEAERPALARVVERVQDVGNREQERGAAERRAGERPHRYRSSVTSAPSRSAGTPVRSKVRTCRGRLTGNVCTRAS